MTNPEILSISSYRLTNNYKRLVGKRKIKTFHYQCKSIAGDPTSIQHLMGKSGKLQLKAFNKRIHSVRRRPDEWRISSKSGLKSLLEMEKSKKMVFFQNTAGQTFAELAQTQYTGIFYIIYIFNEDNDLIVAALSQTEGDVYETVNDFFAGEFYDQIKKMKNDQKLFPASNYNTRHKAQISRNISKSI